MNQAEIALPSRRSDDSYRLLVEGITDYAIYMLDPDGIVSNWNAGAQRFKGYRADEIIGSHFSKFYDENDRTSGLPTRALKIAATQGKFEAEGWRIRKDGSRFWAHVVIDAIRNSDGDLIGYAKITRDLTERRAAELSLRDSQEQFRLLVQSVSDYAIYMLDPEGKVASWNAGAERIKGYAPEEIIGSHFSKFYTDDDAAKGLPTHALETARSTGRFAAEGTRVRKDGTEFRASVVIDAVANDAGELIGFAKITRDVTERDETQRELERAREALFQSQKMDAIGQLTGGIAHDFNNLLMAILSSLELLGKRLPDDPMMQRLVSNAVQGAERGATLTQRMLAFARRQDLNTVSVDIPKTVIGMADLLQRSLGPAWTIETRFPLSLNAVTADVNQLEMALLNLVVNARDAMTDGGVVTIAAREHVVREGEHLQLKPGSYVKLSVTDTGTGMDPKTLARATEPFFTTKGVGKGTGLGLSMIHGFADQLNGAFLLKSSMGIGTTAEIWLPVAITVSAKAIAEAAEPQDVPVTAMTILAVDDDSLILMNTAALLEDMGHTVYSADSGTEALSVFTEHAEIGLVITDQAMPGMTGMELALAIWERSPGFPVILATGFGEISNQGAQPIMRLAKPFNQADLRKSVADALAAAPRST